MSSTWPIPRIYDPRIVVSNKLEKNIHVIVTPNQDWVMAEIYMGFASLVSGGMALANTSGSFLLLLRSLSFVKTLDDTAKKIRGILPESSITIRPGQAVEVFHALKSFSEKWVLSPSGFVSLFGGSQYTLTIVDEDLENSVMFNSGLGAAYYVGRRGVGLPIHYWNGGAMPAGLSSSASPSLIRLNNQMLLLYRHDRGRAIFISEFKDGHFVRLGRGVLNQDTSEVVAVTMMRDKLCVVARHNEGEQLFALWDRNQTIPFDTSLANGTRKWLGVDVTGPPSATTVGDNTYIVAGSSHGISGAKYALIKWAIFQADGTIERGGTNLGCLYAPTIHAFKGQLYMVYANMKREICLAVSTDGRTWQDRSTVHLGKTSSAVALTVYNDRLYLFYRDGSGNGVFYAWTEDGKSFKSAPKDYIYFGFDVEGAPTASPMPGDNNGIMVAGIAPPNSRFFVPKFLEDDAEVVAWTIMQPYEPGNEAQDEQELREWAREEPMFHQMLRSGPAPQNP